MLLRDFILNNLGWKLASVIVAVLIWITINSNIHDGFKPLRLTTRPSSPIGLTLPVTVLSAAPDPRAFRIVPAQVKVTVRGEAAAMSNLNVSDLLVFVNLAGVSDASNVREKVIVHTPPNVAVVKIDPEEVTVTRVAAPDSANSQPHQD